MSNYINGAVGPNPEEVSPQEGAPEGEGGAAPEQDASFTEPASQDKEEANAFENSQAYQPVAASSFAGSNQNLFGPMVPMAPGAFPVPETADGYGGNAVVRSHVPDEGHAKKKQCIDSMFF